MGVLNNYTEIEIERKQAPPDLPGFPGKEIQKQYDWFPYDVYKGRKSRFALLKKVFLDDCLLINNDTHCCHR
jgi:hypothetical protein